MGKRPKNTSKTKCDWQTLTAPPHRRGKLILRDSARKRSVTKPPLRERGRGPRSGGGGDMKQGEGHARTSLADEYNI